MSNSDDSDLHNSELYDEGVPVDVSLPDPDAGGLTGSASWKKLFKVLFFLFLIVLVFGIPFLING